MKTSRHGQHFARYSKEAREVELNKNLDFVEVDLKGDPFIVRCQMIIKASGFGTLMMSNIY